MQQFTIEQKVGQLFFIGIPGPELDESTRKLLLEINPGGVCLFARNIRSALQTRELLNEIRNSLAEEPFLSIDQEGGLVDRLRRIMSPSPSAKKFSDADDVREFAAIVAESLRILGFNMDFAPVVDFIAEKRESTSNGLYSRGFGRDPDEMIELSGTFLDTLRLGGIIGCPKHFPGLGAAVVDSHEALPNVEIGESEFKEIDLRPYREFIGAGKSEMIMVAHAAYPNLDIQERDRDGRLLPSSLSSNFVSGLLRGDLGFKGVAITDDLEMGAIVKNYGIGDACNMALKAGIDMLAICSDEGLIRQAFGSVLDAVESGEVLESRIEISLERIRGLRSKVSQPVLFDQTRLSGLSQRLLALSARLS